LCITPFLVKADVIDFEGLTDQQEVTSLPTATNTVKFSVGNSPGGGPAYAAKVGEPQTAFQPNDTPYNTGISGEMFLTNLLQQGEGSPCYNYYLEFNTPVLSLSLNLYDYRYEETYPYGAAKATLTVFSDLFVTPVGSVEFIPPEGLPDGHVATLAVTNPLTPIITQVT